MKKEAIIQAIGWGAWLILAGIAIVLVRFAEPSTETWVAIAAGGGLSALAVYLTGPARERSPAKLVDLAIVAGAAVVFEIALLASGLGATYVLIAVALPVLVAGLRRRYHRWLLLIVVALVVLAVLIPLIETGRVGVELIATYVSAAGALPFVILWLTGREGSWALWIAYALVATGLIAPVVEAGSLGVDLVATYIFVASALPFVIARLTGRAGGWALLVAYALVATGLFFPLAAGDGRLARYASTFLLAAGALPLLISSLIRRRWGGLGFVGYGLLALAVRIPLIEEGIMAERYSGAYVLLAAALGFLAAAMRRRGSEGLPVLAGTTGAAGIALLVSQGPVTILGAAFLVIAGMGITLRQLTRAEQTGERAHAEQR